MLQFTVIGNLGMDAKVKTVNGRQFVTFDVAHSNSWTDEAGVVHSEQIWVSCIMSGDGGKLLQYLTKGRKVYVVGDGSVRCYSSAVQRRMMAGANISVRTLELLSSNSDDVPRRLVTIQGKVIPVAKAYYIDVNQAAEICGSDEETLLRSERGQEFKVVKAGWVTPLIVSETQSEDANETDHF